MSEQEQTLTDELLATKKELQRALHRVNYLECIYEGLSARHEAQTKELLAYQSGERPTLKQMVMSTLCRNVGGLFMSEKRRWDRAERMYAEGVRRGIYPADPQRGDGR